ncbi:hypothetical protein [Photobacterium kasasachensis]|uniref:hypothetical protein n=1 Tax=Photobacterium kasasachensis TaxID=2910240 RepID=UPI003D0E3A69
MNDDQLYPDWLYKKLIDSDFPWHKKASLSLEAFFEKYTLHDSYWVGVFHHVDLSQSVTIAFQWDSVWLPDEIKEGTSSVDDWPYLIFQLEGAKEVTTANFVDIDGVSRAISGAEVLELDGEKHLAIDDVYGGQVNVVFSGKCSILALNPDESVLKI